MPCAAWGISAKHCKIGSQLRKQPGTVCSKCYAHRGHYRCGNVAAAQERRLQGLNHPQWVDAMVVLIEHATLMAIPYFRWFDSGDLQDVGHLMKIIEIAERLPYITFWLPTHEVLIVQSLHKRIPPNLVIRVSAVKPEDEPRRVWPLTSTVSKDPKKITCPARQQDNHCRDCRACWDKEVPNVCYRQH